MLSGSIVPESEVRDRRNWTPLTNLATGRDTRMIAHLVTIFDLIAAAQPDHAAPLWCDCAWTYRDPQGRYR